MEQLLRRCEIKLKKNKRNSDGKVYRKDYICEKGYFHCWSNKSEVIPPSPTIGGRSGGVISYTVGIVELDSGEVIEVYPTQIKFINRKVKPVSKKEIKE